jgi:hypothetical protein
VRGSDVVYTRPTPSPTAPRRADQWCPREWLGRFFVALDAAAGSGTGPASTGYDRCVNYQRAVGLGILVAALIATSNAFAPSSAMASPRTTPAPGVTCDGLSCDNTNNSDITIHGQMRCNGTGFESFTGVARAHTVTHFPNPNCSNGRPGVDAFFPDR